jgi:hypothetical protein
MEKQKLGLVYKKLGSGRILEQMGLNKSNIYLKDSRLTHWRIVKNARQSCAIEGVYVSKSFSHLLIPSPKKSNK